MSSKTRRGENLIYKPEKRLFDVALSTLLLILGAPWLLFIALAIKLEGPGPIFFVQRRVGLNGKEIELLKFRTMQVNAEEFATRPVFALRDDPRITRVGAFLRRTSFDELPQLFSVLKGDMSLVGPRPALPLEVKHYSSEQAERLKIRPGWTGYWQVFGREHGISDRNKMIEMDLDYARQQSLLLDLKIIAKTFLMGSLGKKSY